MALGTDRASLLRVNTSDTKQENTMELQPFKIEVPLVIQQFRKYLVAIV